MSDIVKKLRGGTYWVTADDCETAAITIDRLRAGSQFLIDRLSELEIPEDLARDWFGHVDPAIARLRDLLRQTP